MRVLLLAVLFLLAFTPQAEARSYSVVTHLHEVEQLRSANSIALADGRVVWIEQRGTAAALVVAGENGVAQDLVVLAPAEGVESFHSVAASGQTAFMQRLACVKPSCSNGGDLLRVDLATGAAVPFDGCLDDGVCAGCPDGRFFALGLRGTVLSSHLPCSQQSAVTDLADGATRHLDGDVLDAVGDLAVVHTDAASSGTLTVRDWRTGRVVTVADGVDLGQLVRAVSIDADGTLAWADGTKLHMRAPGAKRDRVIALEPGDAISDLKVAGGRVRRSRSGTSRGSRRRPSPTIASGRGSPPDR